MHSCQLICYIFSAINFPCFSIKDKWLRWRDAARWTVLFQLFYKHSWDRIGSFSRVTSIQHTYLSRRQRPVDIRRQSLGICRSLDRRSMCVLHVENASTPPSSIATHLRLTSRRSVYVLHVENASTHPSSIASYPFADSPVDVVFMCDRLKMCRLIRSVCWEFGIQCKFGCYRFAHHVWEWVRT